MRAICLVVAVAATATLSAQNVGVTLQNGTDGYMEVASAPALTPTSGLTFEAWLTYDETTLQSGWTWPTVVRQNIAAGQESWFLRVDAGQTATRALTWKVVTNLGSRGVTWTFGAGALLQWTHVAGTYDGAFVRLFVNGAEVANGALTGTILNRGGTLRIGKGDDSIPNGETWNGQIDEARLWPFARTAGEIASTMNLQIAGVPGVVSTWDFHNRFQDSSGALHGAPFGSIAFTANTLQLGLYPISGASSFGASTPGCRGTIDASVTALPRVGNPDFALTVTKAAANANGAILTSFLPLTTPLRILGVDVWPDPAAGSFVVSLRSDVLGVARVPLGIPASQALVGARFHSQYLWIDTCGPNGLTASDGLTVLVLQ